MTPTVHLSQRTAPFLTLVLTFTSKVASLREPVPKLPKLIEFFATLIQSSDLAVCHINKFLITIFDIQARLWSETSWIWVAIRDLDWVYRCFNWLRNVQRRGAPHKVEHFCNIVAAIWTNMISKAEFSLLLNLGLLEDIWRIPRSWGSWGILCSFE